jgi:hypothetical protein
MPVVEGVVFENDTYQITGTITLQNSLRKPDKKKRDDLTHSRQLGGW